MIAPSLHALSHSIKTPLSFRCQYCLTAHPATIVITPLRIRNSPTTILTTTELIAGHRIGTAFAGGTRWDRGTAGRSCGRGRCCYGGGRGGRDRREGDEQVRGVDQADLREGYLRGVGDVGHELVFEGVGGDFYREGLVVEGPGAGGMALVVALGYDVLLFTKKESVDGPPGHDAGDDGAATYESIEAVTV